MKVKELIKLLEKEDPNRIVIIAADAEGDSYSPLAGVEAIKYKAETSYYGHIGLEKLTDDDVAFGYTEDDVMQGGKKAILLTPTN